jgi:hypothetical protein
MPLTTYTAGEVLTASSLNANFSFAAGAGALKLISSTPIGTTVGSVTVSNAFSATYDAYKIVITGGLGSSANQNLALQLGATTTGYYLGAAGVTYSTGAAALIGLDNGSSFTPAGFTLSSGLAMNCDIQNPFLASNTFISGAFVNTSNARTFSGYLANTTSYTAFTITPASGTLTGGNIRVYGYATS